MVAVYHPVRRVLYRSAHGPDFPESEGWIHNPDMKLFEVDALFIEKVDDKLRKLPPAAEENMRRVLLEAEHKMRSGLEMT